LSDLLGLVVLQDADSGEDEDEADSDDDEGKVSFKDIERKSRKLDEERQRMEEDAEAELQEDIERNAGAEGKTFEFPSQETLELESACSRSTRFHLRG
jgi:ribosomal RNA methyltransferase Nop2